LVGAILRQHFRGGLMDRSISSLVHGQAVWRLVVAMVVIGGRVMLDHCLPRGRVATRVRKTR